MEVFNMKKIFSFLLLSFFFIISLSSCGAKSYTITFFNVGKADAILLQYDNTNMIIDTGTKESSEYFVNGLKNLNVSTVDVLILTHFDQDHIGGATSIINNFEVKTIYQTYEVKTSNLMQAYKVALNQKGLTPIEVSEETSFYLGDVSYTIYPPESKAYNNSQSNNSSLVIRSTYNKTSYLFAGDAEKERLKELNAKAPALESDVLKVPHHGGLEDNTSTFFKKIKPSYAIITDSDDEPADSRTISFLTTLEVNIYYTKNGDITLTSDGNSISIKQ